MTTLPDVFCGECQSPMELRTSEFGKFWGCTKYPKCKGSHGAHADGRPLGVPANAETKQARIIAHHFFDGLWRRRGWTRVEGYQWMAHVMGLTRDEAHIGRFTRDQCFALVVECAAAEVKS